MLFNEIIQNEILSYIQNYSIDKLVCIKVIDENNLFIDNCLLKITKKKVLLITKPFNVKQTKLNLIYKEDLILIIKIEDELQFINEIIKMYHKQYSIIIIVNEEQQDDKEKYNYDKIFTFKPLSYQERLQYTNSSELAQRTNGFSKKQLDILKNSNVNHTEFIINLLSKRLDGNYSNSKFNTLDDNDVKIFGYLNEKNRLKDLIMNQWLNPKALNNFGLKKISGILFHGPSGCGKSFIINNYLENCKLFNFISIKSSDIFSKWFGESEENLRKYFKLARNSSPCILFIDEIDILAENRNNNSQSENVYSRVLTTLLNEMDGIDSNEDSNILVIAATNRIESLDDAIVRHGRLGVQIKIDYPNEQDIKSLLENFILNKPSIVYNDNLEELISLFLNKTCVEIEYICNKFLMQKILANTFTITNDEFRNFTFIESIKAF